MVFKEKLLRVPYKFDDFFKQTYDKTSIGFYCSFKLRAELKTVLSAIE